MVAHEIQIRHASGVDVKESIDAGDEEQIKGNALKIVAGGEGGQPEERQRCPSVAVNSDRMADDSLSEMGDRVASTNPAL